jgi:hypothetical protein
MPLSPLQVECLLAALLAVNRCSLEKAWALLPRLRAVGLTDPARVAGMDLATTIEAFSSAGYDRGNITWLFAERVKALMDAVHNGRLEGLDAAISAKDNVAASALLSEIRGVGPTVIKNAWALLTS